VGYNDLSDSDASNKVHKLILMPSGKQGAVAHDSTIQDAVRQLGIELESICGARQTCGKCIVNPEYGTFSKHGITSSTSHLSSPDPNEIAYAEKNTLNLNHQRLGCTTRITGDVLLDIPESSLSRKQVVRKVAGAIAVDVLPSVRLVYVEVPPPTMESRSDWYLLQQALQEQWNLSHLDIDPMLLKTLQATLRQEDGAVTVTVWQEREIVRIEAGYVETLYGLAIDVGSTTLAGYLCDLRTGSVLATETMMNPQVRYGEDIISRISYVTEAQGLQRLHRSIIKALNDLCLKVAESASITSTDITDLVLVGNTVMHHLFLGIDPSELGHVPFALATDDAIDMCARDMGLTKVHNSAKVHVLPCIAGYVGADNVATLLAEVHQFSDDITLVADIGTNAEILLGTKGRILSASSPTGPAFEGAQIAHGQRAAIGAIERVRINESSARYKVIGDDRWNDAIDSDESLRPTGICGSAIIEIVAELFTNGLINSSGKFVREACDSHSNARPVKKSYEFVLAYASQTATGNDIVVTQKDIRAIQLAKAALYASIKLLMDRLEVHKVDRIRLAGAFGSYIDPYYAMQIGLIPDCDLQQVVGVGNAAGDGARIALLNREQRQHIQQLVRQVEYVETAAEAQLQDYFVDALFFPHGSDTFEHLISGDNDD
jgi:uncharacterized 2Fe-2S/4Fe-4S cluster protein (DUF4445 family)